MEMEDQYGLADPRHLMSGRVHFLPISPPPDLYSGHRNQLAAPPSQPYEMLMMAPPGSHHQVSDIMMHHHHHHRPDHDQFQSDYNAHAAITATPVDAFGGGLEAVDMTCLGGDGGTGRWPRQETLTLLEIRSRLDSKFKEANQKGPLWDEVSRIMSEEHGYQRSGKKCREKFENLYKYYKKTKEGKAGRQDGKHYRFFRQLEALYGGGTTCDSTAAYNNNSHQFTASQAVPQPQKLSDSLSLSNNSSELDTSSSHNDDDDSAVAEKGKKRASGGKKSWKAKIREFVDSQMRRLVEKQETWLETMQRSLEHKERERMLRDDAWRKQEASRMDRQQRFWASERAWIKARDAALVEALHTLTSQSQTKNPPVSDNTTTDNDGWSECEIARLVQLRTGMNERFGQIGCSEEVLWEEIAAEMGYQRSACMCKEKWTYITTTTTTNNNNNSLFLKECNFISKKRKENCTRSYCYFPTAADSGYDHVVGAGAAAGAATQTVPYFEMDERGQKMAAQTSELLNGSSSSSPCDPPPNGPQVQEGCFRMMMADGGSNLWEDYGLKLN